MQCRRCHHTDGVHTDSGGGPPILGLGACQVPDCTCGGYVDAIREIDEDLL